MPEQQRKALRSNYSFGFLIQLEGVSQSVSFMHTLNEKDRGQKYIQARFATIRGLVRLNFEEITG